MTIQITSTATASELHGIKVLVYGNAGIGKTVLASTAPSPIILSAESGLLSLRKQNIPCILIKSVEDLYEAYAVLSKSEEGNKYQTICLDSITEIAEVVLSTKKATAKDPRQAYGELIEIMTGLIKAFRDMPNKHVYFSAKMEPFKDELSGVVKYGPAMPGSKLGPQLPYLFDEVFKLVLVRPPQGGEAYRALQTFPDIQSEGKDRSGMLASYEPPDLTAVFNKILS